MLNEIMASEMLVDLSDEQQELLTGGVDFITDGTSYLQKLVALQSQTGSGPNGSFSNSSAATLKIDTKAFQTIAVGAPKLIKVH
jgi:hypothetical protein